jgi:hypothetical protein
MGRSGSELCRRGARLAAPEVDAERGEQVVDELPHCPGRVVLAAKRPARPHKKAIQN